MPTKEEYAAAVGAAAQVAAAFATHGGSDKDSIKHVVKLFEDVLEAALSRSHAPLLAAISELPD